MSLARVPTPSLNRMNGVHHQAESLTPGEQATTTRISSDTMATSDETTDDVEDYHERAYACYHADSDARTWNLARDIVDTHVRNEIVSGRQDVSIQDRLTDTPSRNELIDGFCSSIKEHDLRVQPQTTGFEYFILDITARYPETAHVESDNENIAPSMHDIESRVWVYCELGVRAKIAGFVGVNTECRIYAPQELN